MKKNIIIVALVLIVPLVAFWILSNANTTTAQTNPEIPQTDQVVNEVAIGKPQILQFTSTMCLDCQTMNKLFKEVYPKYQDKIVLTEISVQDGKAFTNEQIKKYNITLVPTMIFLDSNNNQVQRIEGAIEKEVLENYLKELK